MQRKDDLLALEYARSYPESLLGKSKLKYEPVSVSSLGADQMMMNRLKGFYFCPVLVV